jgi:hypothetical protein
MATAVLFVLGMEECEMNGWLQFLLYCAWLIIGLSGLYDETRRTETE